VADGVVGADALRAVNVEGLHACSDKLSYTILSF
jgi:hypothetical protein